MNTIFADVVEDVKQVSFDEKLELKDLLEIYLIEERRSDILENGKQSRRQLKENKLEFSSNVDELMRSLND